jgi:hypothetical protein
MQDPQENIHHIVPKVDVMGVAVVLKHHSVNRWRGNGTSKGRAHSEANGSAWFPVLEEWFHQVMRSRFSVGDIHGDDNHYDRIGFSAY